MTPRTQRTALAATLLALAGLVTACGGEADNVGPSAADPQSYYDDYDEGDQGVAGASNSNVGAPAAAQDGQQPGLLEDNTFVDAGMSGYQDPSDEPESTFALDVDNGSFRVAQALVAQGLQPPAESVRSEEWVNALPYDDPAPTETDLALRTETGMAPRLDDGTQEVRVAVTARELAAQDRPSVNLTLVVDRSGSMDIRSRLGLVKSSIALLAESLRPDDTVSVVAFDDTVDLILPPTSVAEGETILDSVDRLQPGGSTNLAAGLELGYEQARTAYRPGGVNVVVLCSDGVANVGITGPDSITATIAEQGQRGIHLVTVGYGMGNYNDHLMEQLADQGDGFYRYVDTYEEARHLYVDDLTSLLTPVADDARAQVEFDPELVSSYRLIGYDNRAMADESFEDLGVDAGELGAGHRASALYEVRLATGVAPGTQIGTARVRWLSAATRAMGVAESPVLAADPKATPSDSFALATAAADLAELVKLGGYDGEYEADDPTGRTTSYAGIRARVDALVARGVPGASDLLALLDGCEGGTPGY
jgi:Ca-activated chloride channel family protein